MGNSGYGWRRKISPVVNRGLYTLLCIVGKRPKSNTICVNVSRTRRPGGKFHRMRYAFYSRRSILPFALILWWCTPAGVQADDSRSNAVTIPQGPDVLVHEVVHNEIEAQLQDRSLWCHREQTQEDGKASKTADICETRDGDLERVIAVDGKELSLAQSEAEDRRIQDIIKHPDQLKSKQKKQREDGEQERNMFKMFADAFCFQIERQSGALITLRFRPNPAFRPTTRASQVFHHMEGTLAVNAESKRLVKINGRLTSEVKFLGGILGHLDKDGTFTVRQEEVGPGHWDLTYLNVHMNGKVLCFKTITVLQKKTLSDYRPLPSDVTLQQTADLLRHDFIAKNGGGSSGK